MRHQDGDLIHDAALEMMPARILLAEDHAETRALLASRLRKDGYEVVEVSNGRQLLIEMGSALLGDSDSYPDLVITDVRMPGLSGLQVLAGLRASCWSTPVIIITAFGDDEVHAEARRLGVSGVLDKPFDLEDFRAAVVKAVGPARAGRGASTLAK